MQSKIQYLGHSFHIARQADSDYVSDSVIFTIKWVFNTQNEKKMTKTDTYSETAHRTCSNELHKDGMP